MTLLIKWVFGCGSTLGSLASPPRYSVPSVCSVPAPCHQKRNNACWTGTSLPPLPTSYYCWKYQAWISLINNSSPHNISHQNVFSGRLKCQSHLSSVLPRSPWRQWFPYIEWPRVCVGHVWQHIAVTDWKRDALTCRRPSQDQSARCTGCHPLHRTVMRKFLSDLLTNIRP